MVQSGTPVFRFFDKPFGYYNLYFSDAEKQNTMNVFLGIFVPESGKPPIWEKDFNFDYYLHHQVRIDIVKFKYRSNFFK